MWEKCKNTPLSLDWRFIHSRHQPSLLSACTSAPVLLLFCFVFPLLFSPGSYSCGTLDRVVPQPCVYLPCFDPNGRIDLWVSAWERECVCCTVRRWTWTEQSQLVKSVSFICTLKLKMRLPWLQHHLNIFYGHFHSTVLMQCFYLSWEVAYKHSVFTHTRCSSVCVHVLSVSSCASALIKLSLFFLINHTLSQMETSVT